MQKGDDAHAASVAGANCFDRVPRDVLAIIVGKCLASDPVVQAEQAVSDEQPAVSRSKFSLFKKKAPPSPPPPSDISLVEREAFFMMAVSKCVASLASVCRAFARAAATEEVARQALLAARQRVPERVWYGAKMSDAFRAQYRLLQEHVREDKLQQIANQKPEYGIACGMRAPPGHPEPHPADPPSFEAFAGLNEMEMQRVQKRAESLLQFLRAFGSFAVGFKAEAALLRYRMFLKLQSDHPNTLLLPTADILFAQLTHIFRTADYHADVASGSVLLARDPLCLSREEEPLYNDACVATARLWESSYGELYFASDAVKQHAFFVHQVDKGPFTPKWLAARYVPPPAYVAAVGPAPTRKMTDLPEIRLKAVDVRNDLKWMPELDISFRNICTQAYRKLGIFDSSDANVIQHLSLSYQRFLFLCKTRPDLGHDLAPPVALDLLWHAHQATPRLYEEETTRIVGFRVDHDPWPQGKSDLRPLSEQMKCAWKTAFQTDMEDDHWFGGPQAKMRVPVQLQGAMALPPNMG